MSGRHAHSDDVRGRTASIALLTVSDTRTRETDRSGDWLAAAVEGDGHRLADRGLEPDDPDRVRDWVAARLAAPGIDLVVTTGGTGLSARDRTVEALRGEIVRALPGFGELFRMLSHAEIGSAAMMSRAFAGQAGGGAFLFCLPGSTGAVRLGWSALIGPEIGHLLAERDRARG